MITFGPKVNRRYSTYLTILKEQFVLDIYFSKNNTFLGFVTDNTIYRLNKENKLVTTIYRDLGESSFATNFLDLKDFKSNTLDIKCQFNNIKNDYKDKIQYVSNETIKISKVTTSNGVFDNLLFVYIFTFSNYPEDFLYIVAERQHIDTMLGKKLVRTCALQISTKEKADDLSDMVTSINGGGEKLSDINDGLKEVLG
jgi:hypothetical protein